MYNRAQGGVVGAIVALIVVFIIFDLFFCGCFLIDEPILKTIKQSTGTILLAITIDASELQEEGGGDG